MNIHVSTNTYSNNTSRMQRVVQLMMSTRREFHLEITRGKKILETVVSVFIRSTMCVVFVPGCECCGSLSIFCPIDLDVSVY